MNIEQAKAIPMVEILDRLHLAPAKIRHDDYWYYSPLRDEKTPSFKVNAYKNLWYDFGEGKGGDVISFVCAYLESSHEANTVYDALRWLRNMTGTFLVAKPVAEARKPTEPSPFVIKDVKAIEHRLLIAYLQSRGISLSLAQKYFKQLRILNRETKKSFFALGFQNENENFEVRNPFFKSCLGSKTISFMRGADTKNKGIHIFEGSFDFLSALQQQNKPQFDDDAIVLNSTSCLQFAFPYIKNYGYKIAYTWLDNDKAGIKAKTILDAFFQSENQLSHKPMNEFYAPHKDVNAGHMHKLGLKG